MTAIMVLLATLIAAPGMDPQTGNRVIPLRDEVRLSLSADRQTYYRGEAMRLDFSLTNVTDHEVQGVFALHPGLSSTTILYRRPGAGSYVALQCFLPPRDSAAKPVRTLRAGEQITSTVRVALLALERNQQRFLLEAAGTYEFKLDYQDLPEDPNAFLESNVLAVEVVEAPEGEQAAQAAYTTSLAYLAQIASGPRAFLSSEDVAAAATFIQRYSQSRYAGPVKEGLIKWLQYRTGTQRATPEERALYEELTRKTDTTAPELHVEVSPPMLWPPNHKPVQVLTTVSMSDDQDPSPVVKLVAITCDGCDPAEDITGAELGTDDREFELRAERKGSGSGRTYTVTYSATDASGNEALATVKVVVPHDQGK